MNKKIWIIIAIVMAILAISGLYYANAIRERNNNNEAEAAIVRHIEKVNEQEDSESMHCERSVIMSANTSYTHATGEFEVQGDIYIDDSAGIEKAQLKIAMDYDNIQAKANYEDYVVKTFDITDNLLPDKQANKVDEYTKYNFSLKGIVKEQDGFDIDRGFDFAILITFGDGYEGIVFQHR